MSRINKFGLMVAVLGIVGFMKYMDIPEQSIKLVFCEILAFFGSVMFFIDKK